MPALTLLLLFTALKYSDLRHSTLFFSFLETCVLSGSSVTAALESSNVITLTTELLQKTLGVNARVHSVEKGKFFESLVSHVRMDLASGSQLLLGNNVL